MKRCPECRKEYLDDSLLYCFDDGAALVQGSVTDEPATAILSGDLVSDEGSTRHLSDGQRFLMGTLIGGATAPPPTVILNWTELLKK